jgi:hypothetical protein
MKPAIPFVVRLSSIPMPGLSPLSTDARHVPTDFVLRASQPKIKTKQRLKIANFESVKICEIRVTTFFEF